MPSPYSDLDRPPLSAAILARALVRPGSLWNAVRVQAQTASTNADVVAAAAAGAPEGLVELAESQTRGRGRLDREWVSPPRAGLTFSVLLRPTVRREQWGWLPLLAGLAVTRAVEQVTELSTALKWPNDVLLGEAWQKVAGILAGVTGDAVVLGVGVNVSTRRDELPSAAATSLAIAGAASTDRMPLLVAILRAMEDSYAGWLAGADLRPAYLDRCQTVGQPVRVSYPGGREATGEAVDVDDVGRLVIEGEDGSTVLVAAGDVTHVRRR